MELLRSAMFVPGHRARFVDKALGGLAADAIMLDLEDGVPPPEKAGGRQLVAAALGRPRVGATARYVRVNGLGSPWLGDDLAAVVRTGLDGLVLPKIDTAAQLAQVDSWVAEHERAQGLASGQVRYIVALESPRGLLQAAAIAAGSARVAAVMFGAEDYGRELGLPVRRTGAAAELVYARSALVVAAAAANVQALDGVWPDIQDAAGLARDCGLARELGFTGKSLIHPGQIAAINAAFSPGAEEIEYAERVVAAFEAAQAQGEGSIAFGGQLIDLPIVERARRTLALAATLGPPTA